MYNGFENEFDQYATYDMNNMLSMDIRIIKTCSTMKINIYKHVKPISLT